MQKIKSEILKISAKKMLILKFSNSPQKTKTEIFERNLNIKILKIYAKKLSPKF